MKALRVLVILAWFFGFRVPFGATMASTVIGPFKSRASCRAAFEDAAAGLVSIPGISFTKCNDFRDA